MRTLTCWSVVVMKGAKESMPGGDASDRGCISFVLSWSLAVSDERLGTGWVIISEVMNYDRGRCSVGWRCYTVQRNRKEGVMQ